MMHTSQRSASNWKCLLLWEGQDSFILGSVLTGRIDFRMCWEKYFVISCLGRRLKRGNARKRKICVTSTEGRTRNSAGSLRILRCRPSRHSSQTPLSSLGFLFSLVTQILDLVPPPCSHAWESQNAMPHAPRSKNWNSNVIQKTQSEDLALGCAGCSPLRSRLGLSQWCSEFDSMVSFFNCMPVPI